MTPNELRALADALPEGVHWSDPITPEMLAEAIKRFCADAQPVAMLASHRRLIEQAIQSAEHPSGMSTHDGKARIDASVLRRMLAIIDSLSAAPQAEPKREPLSDERIAEIQRAAYERAAQECDSMAYEPLGLDVNSCIACADAIRALGREK